MRFNKIEPPYAARIPEFVEMQHLTRKAGACVWLSSWFVGISTLDVNPSGLTPLINPFTDALPNMEELFSHRCLQYF